MSFRVIYIERMKVLKFGGSSVGSVNSILSVKKIVEAVEEPVIVVVSALGGITDQLIKTSEMAAKGDIAYEKEYRDIVNRHIEMVYTVIPAGEPRSILLDKVNELLSELKNIFQGIYLIRDLSSKTSATIVSYGERLSSIIVATLIKDAVWYDSRTFIKTERKHARHILDSDLTNDLVRETFKDSKKWNQMSLLNIAYSGRFAADRAINEYARNIWNTQKMV